METELRNRIQSLLSYPLWPNAIFFPGLSHHHHGPRIWARFYGVIFRDTLAFVVFSCRFIPTLLIRLPSP